jgi:N-formylmaleamate deformylase
MNRTYNYLRTLGFLLISASCAIAATSSQTDTSGRNTAGKAKAGQANPSFSVKISGHGAPMIFIPGLSSSGETWNSTVAHYQDHYTCYVLTVAGFAGQPPIQTPLLSTVRDDLAAYIEKQHLKKPVIVGHSLGGNIALGLAARHPDLVGPVVIVDSLPFYANAWFQVSTLDEAKPMIAGMKKSLDDQTQDQYEQGVRSGVYTKYMASSPSDQQTLIQWGLASDPRSVHGDMLELVSEDLRPELANIKSPTLVLGTWSGLHDQLQPMGINITKEQITQTFQHQYTNLPQMHFALADKARHFIMWDDPAWFFQQLDAFLANPAVVTKDRGFGVSPSPVAASPSH